MLTPVKNEAWILERFLEVTSRFADMIIIADQQSSDKGPEVCARFEKVKFLSNPNAAFNEAERQVFLIEAARKLSPGPRILLALDADEILAADAIQSPDWNTMLSAPQGTVLYFEKPDLTPAAGYCIRYRDNLQPLGFVDDGVTSHRPQKIHSIRIPTVENSPRLMLNGIKILHYGPARKKAQLAKNHYYSVLENVAGINPVHRRRAFYGEAQSRWQSLKFREKEHVPESWLKGWEEAGIEMRSIRDEEYYWQEIEVIRAFARDGARRFWLDDIWNFDWEALRQRALRLGVTGMPDTPIVPPPLGFRLVGKGIDGLRRVTSIPGFARIKKGLSYCRKSRRTGWKRSLLELVTKLCSFVTPCVSKQILEPHAIFVLRNNDIGDLLAITPLFEALKKKFPTAKIIAGVGSWNLDVLKNNPFVDEILPVNAPWHNQQTKPQGLFSALRYILFSGEINDITRGRCAIGIDVLGSAFGSLLLMRAGIPFRLGVRGYAGGQSAAQRCVIYDGNVHVGRAAMGFAELLGATDLPENRPQIYLDEQPSSSGAIVIAQGGGFAEKCWPLVNYMELVRLLAGRKIIVIGGKNDVAAGAKLASAGAGIEDATGKLSLRETFGVIAASALVICNSSMAMHAAAAFRKPSLVLLGDWISSASAHAAQWGYPESRVLGKDRGRDRIYSPEEVLELVKQQ